MATTDVRWESTVVWEGADTVIRRLPPSSLRESSFEWRQSRRPMPSRSWTSERAAPESHFIYISISIREDSGFARLVRTNVMENDVKMHIVIVIKNNNTNSSEPNQFG